MGVEAFEAECAAKAEARAAQEAARAAGALSRKEQKNQSYWQRRNQRKKASWVPGFCTEVEDPNIIKYIQISHCLGVLRYYMLLCDSCMFLYPDLQCVMSPCSMPPC